MYFLGVFRRRQNAMQSNQSDGSLDLHATSLLLHLNARQNYDSAHAVLAPPTSYEQEQLHVLLMAGLCDSSPCSCACVTFRLCRLHLYGTCKSRYYSKTISSRFQHVCNQLRAVICKRAQLYFSLKLAGFSPFSRYDTGVSCISGAELCVF